MSDEANPKDALGAKKVDLALVPPASTIHEATAFENGAKKYGPYNWREKKVRAMVYIAAALRHTLEYLDGVDYSSDTQPPVHSLAHAKACFGIVLDAMETGNLIDDRPKAGAAERLVTRVQVTEDVPSRITTTEKAATRFKQELRKLPEEVKIKLRDAWFNTEQDAVASGLNAIATEMTCGKKGCDNPDHVANRPSRRLD